MTTPNPHAGYIKTFTGRMVQPLALKVDDIDIRDIAHALARVCRFAGQCAGFLSVAGHSVRVLRRAERHWNNAAPPNYFLTALLHDASEAYLGDVAKNVKHHPAYSFFRELEAKAEAVIAKRFGLLYPLPASIKAFDDQEGDYEAAELRYDPFRMEDPKVTCADFLDHFRGLGGVE